MQLCCTSRDLISNQQVWLAQIRRLDQAHAPNLHLHVDARTLKSFELRSLVVKAVQGYENWRNGTIGEDKIVCVELNDPPTIGSSEISEEKPWFCSYFYYNEPTYSIPAPMIKLVPGGRHLFVLWSNGFLQMVDTETQKATWTYPESQAMGELLMPVEAFDVDFQRHNSATVVISRLSKQDVQVQSRGM